MRILIIGQPSNNRGDEAAAQGMIYGIKRRLRNAKFDIVYSGEGLDPVIADSDHITNHHRRFLLRIGKLVALKHLYYLMLHQSGIEPGLQCDEAHLARLIVSCDAVLYAPSGPYLSDTQSNKKPLFFMMLAKLYKKKVMIYAPSVGPFKRKMSYTPRRLLTRIARKFILNRIDVITVRDRRSFEYLQYLNIRNKNVFLALDSALQNPIDLGAGKQLCEQNLIDAGERLLIGITPIELSWHAHWSRVDGIDDKIARISAMTLDHCVSKYHAQIVFFPQLFGKIGSPHSSDLPVIYRVIHYMQNKAGTRIVDPYYSSKQQQTLMSYMKLFIGFRHHSAVLSAKMQIPCICISYEHKAVSFMEDCKLENYVIPLEQLSYTNILAMVEDVLENRAKIIEHLKDISDSIRQKALISSQEFAKMVEDRVNKYHH